MAHPPTPSPENAVPPGNVPRTVPSREPAHEPPVFETTRLRLRPWRDTDAPGPGEGPDGDSLRFMPAGAQPGPDDFPAWLAKRRRDMDSGSDLHWCITDVTSDAMLGNVQIFQMGPVRDRFQGELGYWLRPGARGRGIIGEAIRPVIAHAFKPVENGGLGLSRLHAATDSDNLASQSILRSAGFTQWGADHQGWRRADGSLSDGLYFELLASALPPSEQQAFELAASALPAFELPAGTDPSSTAGEIGYWTHPDARGRGVMSEAVRLAMRHAFIPREDGGLGRRRLRLNAAAGNSASQHIARANGFVEVGRDRQAEPLGDGTFADLVRFDVLADEWPVTE